ncbi:chemotaxis protein CheB [Saccharothrix coeruleofusca]|uniref:protein-glutamate methylesterase n=1 Tax=Saccharothrix coeruleofusca TaxID=33919 RepID=A0A918EGY6_9PSEU|nr:chemotaxis protein CheB [Saccharothrix coeruleofusca]MBP2335324.1 two-component system chemotaxis response regulator CheB [Saccharothrix coeruleofusca]GGP77125.1 chemotaxis protein CheB [Saccharothrix coeruleofusca]
MPLVPRDLIVVGASAGGVEALRGFVANLPPDLPAAVAVVLHLPAGGTSALPAILDRSGPLPAVSARHGMPVVRGRVHVAPPDHHLLVVDGEFRLSHGPTENGHRPAVDALFRSAAVARGAGAIGVILSGTLDDGTAGVVAIVSRGGLAVVQDPEEALYRGMPESVLRHVPDAQVQPVGKMGFLLREHALQEVETGGDAGMPELLRLEARLAGGGGGATPGEVDEMGTPSDFSCPDCHGTLIELDAEHKRFRCQVGHAWTAEALLDAQAVSLEKALWTALRTLEEKVKLAKRMGREAEARGNRWLADRYGHTEREAQDAADVLRDHLLSGLFNRQSNAERSG